MAMITESKLADCRYWQSVIVTFDDTSIEAISSFGEHTMQAVANCTDQLLHHLQLPINQGANVSFKQQIRKQSKRHKKHWWQKAKRSTLSEYQQLGVELEQTFNQVLAHQQELKQSLKGLQSLYEANAQAAQQLEQALATSELLCQRAQQTLVATRFEALGQLWQQRQLELQQAHYVVEMNMIQIRSLQQANNQLIELIDSAVSVTIPLFQQSLQAVIQAEQQQQVQHSMQALIKRLIAHEQVMNIEMVPQTEYQQHYRQLLVSLEQAQQFEQQRIEIYTKKPQRGWGNVAFKIN